jgi:hypothetical protein
MSKILEHAALRLEFDREEGGLVAVANKLTGETYAVTRDSDDRARGSKERSRLNKKDNKPMTPLIVLAGQSNAQGWMGDGRILRREPVDDRILFRWIILGRNNMLSGESQHGQGWETLGVQNGICGYGNPALHFGPEIQMARTLAKGGERMAVVKATIGASSLYGDWRLPGQGGLTDAMLSEVEDARRDLRAGGRNARVRGLLWIQGESDADTDEHAQGYGGLLAELIAKLRQQWKEPGLPVVLGMDEQHPGPAARPRVVEAQRAIAGADPMVAWTSMRGLEKADESHLANAGLMKHGERLAGALSRLWEKEEPT